MFVIEYKNYKRPMNKLFIADEDGGGYCLLAAWDARKFESYDDAEACRQHIAEQEFVSWTYTKKIMKHLHIVEWGSLHDSIVREHKENEQQFVKMITGMAASMKKPPRPTWTEEDLKERKRLDRQRRKECIYVSRGLRT